MDYAAFEEMLLNLCRSIVKGSQRIKTIVGELRDFAQQGSAKLDEEVNLNEVVQSSITLLTNMLKKSTDRFSTELSAEPLMVRGNTQRLEQVAINLIQNACQALDGKDQALRVSTCADSSGNMVYLTVEDEGCGMDSDTLAHIMDPFFTTKRTRGGTGLGLSIAGGIVEEHGGALEFTSRLGQGTSAVLRLPAVSKRNRNDRESAG